MTLHEAISVAFESPASPRMYVSRRLAEALRDVAIAAQARQGASARFCSYQVREGEFAGEAWSKAKHYALHDECVTASNALDAALARLREAAVQ